MAAYSAAAAALAEDCTALHRTIRELKKSYIEQGDRNGGNATTATSLRELETAAFELIRLAPSFCSELANSCRRALGVLMQDFKYNVNQLQKQQKEQAYLTYQSSTSSSNEGSRSRSRSEDDPLAQDKMRMQLRTQSQTQTSMQMQLQLWGAYAQGLGCLRTLMKKHVESSGVNHNAVPQLQLSYSPEARRRASNLLDELFSVGVPRPFSRIQQQGSPSTLPKVTSDSNRYDTRHRAVLWKLEQAYNSTLQNENLTSAERVDWHQRSTVYWSAQTCDLFKLVVKEVGGNDSLWSSTRIREHAYSFLAAALKTLWLAYSESSEIRSVNGNVVLRESIACCIWQTCDCVYEFFNLNEVPWMQEHLANCERSVSDFHIPRIDDTARILQDSSQNSRHSMESNQPQRAMVEDLWRMTSPELQAGSFMQDYGILSNNTAALQSSTIPTGLPGQVSSDQFYGSGAIPAGAIPLMSGGFGGFGADTQSLQNQFDHMTFQQPSLQTHFGIQNPAILRPDLSSPATDGYQLRRNEVQITAEGAQIPSSSVSSPFEVGLSTLDREPQFASQWIVSKTYMFSKSSDSENSLRLWTRRYRNDGRACAPHESIHGLSNTELIPHYAFEPLSAKDQLLYLRCGGAQSGLTFRFSQHTIDPQGAVEETIAFQSALLGATLEGEYPVMEMLLKRSDSTVEHLKPVRMQLWIDDPSWRKPQQAQHHKPNTESPRQMSSRRDLTIPQNSFSALKGSKLFIFAKWSIFVILITDEIICESSRTATMLKLAPNKRSGRSLISIRKLQGTSTAPAGLPLDQAGLSYNDMRGSSSLFSPYKSVEIHFGGDNILKGFEEDFTAQAKKWSNHPSQPKQFRANERNSRVQATSRIQRKDPRRL